jgi:hypothetical protein
MAVKNQGMTSGITSLEFWRFRTSLAIRFLISSVKGKIAFLRMLQGEQAGRKLSTVCAPPFESG